MLVEQDNMVAGLKRGKQGSPLGCLLLRLTHVAGALHIAHILNIERDIVLQALDIFLNALTHKSHLGLADDSECNLHNKIILLKISTKLANPLKYQYFCALENH